MSDTSRRSVLAAVGTGAVATAALAAAPRAAAAPSTKASGAHENLVAYVRAGAGSITLLVGERRVVVHDPDLVRRLARAARR
ncbi:MAG TPA: hypothetical protein VFJ94_06510 [Intrasporangium sp.]|uniref:hypothetical protein n=1 Tax=Intrasporangium sp. TaxID=1925024 RepID=UPI002D77EC77|nr:hypothetical protein [Intrasporangium sp.]HET7398156.1 hypothetical protein [Intrasporangium sp.]